MKPDYMVNFKTLGGKWENEYFFGEKSAREYANEQWKFGARLVILYKRSKHRGGWNEVARAVNTENEAKARRAVAIAELESKLA